MTHLVLFLVAAAGLGFSLAADEKSPAVKPCAKMAIIVYGDLEPKDVEDIQATVNKFMVKVRATCVKEEGA